MKRFYTILTIAGCLFISTSKVNAQNPEEEDKYIELGFELLKKEKIGDIEYGMYLNRVTQLLGEADEKGMPEFNESDGEYHQILKYKSFGIELDITGENFNEKKISIITATEPCTFKTKKGIGIGSSYDEVEKAYEKYINQDVLNSDYITAGSAYGGILFKFNDQKVISITMGVMAL